jgi:hypothetical protein
MDFENFELWKLFSSYFPVLTRLKRFHPPKENVNAALIFGCWIAVEPDPLIFQIHAKE